MTAIDSLERARKYLAAVPGAISGQEGHNQTFIAACALVWGFALSEGDALRLLLEWNATCQPPWSERELEHKVRSAASAHHDKPRGHLLGPGVRCQPFTTTKRLPPRRRATIDPVSAVENFLKGFKAEEVELWEVSPIRPPDNWQLDSITLLEALYFPGQRINFVTEYTLDRQKDGTVKARPAGNGETWERNDLIDHWRANGTNFSEAGTWLRMNPLDGAGIKDINVVSFRFMLLESDLLPLDLQLSLFCRLPLPVAAISTSGGKSLHCWVRVDAKDVDEYRDTVSRVLAPLHRFGIDGKNKNPARLSRLPGVQRQLGAHEDGRQRLLYLNPNPEQRRIFS